MGFVLDIGPRFFLLADIDETIRLNGFYVYASPMSGASKPHIDTRGSS